jgi:hypothetical protein
MAPAFAHIEWKNVPPQSAEAEFGRKYQMVFETLILNLSVHITK